MTSRGWWCLVSVVAMLLAGIVKVVPPLIVTGLVLLLWFGWEWLLFAVRVRTLRQRLRVERHVSDERGPVSTLWAGRFFTVRVSLHLQGGGRIPYLSVSDPVPFGVQHDEGATTTDGELTAKAPLSLQYDVYCPLTGVARFEGLRVEMTDLQGFFCHVMFVREPAVYLIMPSSLIYKSSGPTLKRHNQLPPPGIHRVHQPGSGSELLDLRDYIPGDPPRTIAWKVSARRDCLITKEYESEVPVRCTLFLDTSSSVRVPSPPFAPADRSKKKKRRPAYFKPLDRLVDLAAGVIRASVSIRDLIGLCVFDEHSSQLVRPDRTARHPNRLFQLLGEAAALSPVAGRADPETLAPIAYSLAQEIYPDLLRSEVNAVPWWFAFFVAFPRFTRHRRGMIDELHRKKVTILYWCITVIPLSILVLSIASLFLDNVPGWARGVLGGLLFIGAPLAATLGWILFLFSMLVSSKQRRRARWRKSLAALFAVRYGPIPGGLEGLLHDDNQYSLYLQRFLAEHQVPCHVPLFDEHGRYQFAKPEKIAVLARAVVEAASRGRDNELFVIMADLMELDGCLDPLLQAIRVARSRHHQVLVVCPWPQGVPLPEEDNPLRPPGDASLHGLITALTIKRLHIAYKSMRRTFARLGVQMIYATDEESVSLIINRVERIRSVGGRR